MLIVCIYPRFNQLAVSVSFAVLIIFACLQNTNLFDTQSQYSSKIQAAGIAATEGHYRQARMLAHDALRLRDSLLSNQNKSTKVDVATFTDEMNEYELAETLISLGNYRDAKYVLETLPNVLEAPGEREYHASFAYRHYLHGAALLGLHEYQQAIETLRPALINKPMSVGAEFLLAEAYLAMHEPATAAAWLERMRNFRNQKLFNVYIQMTSLRVGDNKAAKHITGELMTFWRELESKQAPEGISNLEFASEFMKQNGFIAEAVELRTEAERLKQQ